MKLLILVIAFSLSIQSCRAQINDFQGDDINLFRGKAWKLAKAVKNQEANKIKKIINQGSISVNYQEPKFGKTLLIWAVQTNRFESAEALLESGADPNIQDNYSGTSALMEAADKDNTSEYVRLLLQFGGDPNKEAEASEPNRIATPLIAAAKKRLESVKLLVKAGADINHITKHGGSALDAAFMRDQVETVMYLIFDGDAVFKRSFGNRTDGSDIRIGDLLRRWVFPLDSDEYRKKMKIVAYIEEQGEEYWSRPVPKHYFNNYPKEFLEKY